MGSAFVNAYNSRPMLHLRQERNKRYDSYTFVEAVRLEEPPSHSELRGAYRIAGNSFRGKMRKLFIILADDHVPAASSPPAKAAKPGGKDGKANKRKSSADASSATRKKMPSTQ